MITGKLLGDGGISKQLRRRPRFRFTHWHKDFKWTKYCYKKLVNYIPLNPPVFKKTLDIRLKKGYSLAYVVQSRTSDIICYLYKKWHSKGVKVIPFDLLTKYFNHQSLAWWYMDDGHLKLKNNTPQKIVLSTDSFTPKENQWLINFLYEKYKLSFRLDKENRIIIYDQFQIIYFLNLIKPYLNECMFRKMLPLRPIQYNLTRRRTSLYLPQSIHITSPTAEINHQLKHLPQIVKAYKAGLFYVTYEKSLFLSTNKKQKS